MPLIQILSYSRKKEFESPPILEGEIRKEIFTLPLLMKRELETFESDVNKLFFITLYGYFKLTRTFYDSSSFILEDLTYIQKEYDLVQSRVQIKICTKADTDSLSKLNSAFPLALNHSSSSSYINLLL